MDMIIIAIFIILCVFIYIKIKQFEKDDNWMD